MVVFSSIRFEVAYCFRKAVGRLVNSRIANTDKMTVINKRRMGLGDSIRHNYDITDYVCATPDIGKGLAAKSMTEEVE